MLNPNRKSFIFLSGLIGGVCLSLLIGMGLFYSYTMEALQQSLLTPTQQIILFQVATSTSVPSQNDLLDEAEVALNSGQPEKVRDLLYPSIKAWTSNDDRIRGYKLLGEAELAQGHPQLAAPYFERLYFYQPSAENLFFLAATYDSGGDNRNALAKYQELEKWQNLPEEIDIELIRMRIDHIRRALGTPVPTSTPLP